MASLRESANIVLAFAGVMGLVGASMCGVFAATSDGAYDQLELGIFGAFMLVVAAVLGLVGGIMHGIAAARARD